MSFSYCAFVLTDRAHPVHRDYHDNEYGFWTDDESRLFERLVLEINQAGLSWETILKKREGFWRAYEGFDVDQVAAYGEADVARLLADPGIIRNRLKVNAAIHNAQQIQQIRAEHGSFSAWLESHRALDKPAWVKLFKNTFKFTGGEIVGEFLMSLGYLPGTHDDDCPAGVRAAASRPASPPK
ncbi:MAG: DNA-3-methyladenine glycosylase I [Chthonomonas sp.]|nr:DNA-3-methyladenine glycosylase I [Chthonomonas sp.]